MTTCIILSILLVVSFVGITIWKTKNVPESISAMVYSLPDGALKWTWSIWLWLVSLFSFIPVIDILDKQGLGFLAFATLVLLFFTGAWPLFDIEHRKYHYAFAIAAGVLSQVCVWYVCPWWLFGWLLWLGLAVYCYVSYKKGRDTVFDGAAVFVAEIVCIMTVHGASLCRC